MEHLTFVVACETAIKDYHNPQKDGPLLVAIRTNVDQPFVPNSTGWMVFPEYSATIAAWATPRAHPYGGLSNHGPEYHKDPAAAIAALLEQSKELWRGRQPEYDDEEEVTEDPELVAERAALDKLLD